ncbi:hypothetical protein EXN32_11585 [Agrobacterium tumefaciens]|uniref:Uncharacterized protein n=2 Tax=Rhizobium/Agrobacterium group TaxID=227290 RepID=A0A2Z2PJK1_RHIRH|nr:MULTISPECIES: hypothetical protein [Rhizobium/Agrobacterium group]ASK42863.1 hypothetical protein [Rhizobium rhizogenes]MCZ7976372.1 hypothetical protein [Agrobacterium salinitolerans]MDA5243260.1 hypothetical protein [Agrobacterium sp. MAFF310724]MDA5247558.1 hypothetical protein [Agrobacterium sp. MAFF210268]TRB03237.1 hypothetical protein EXN61_23200 [Agrobacterium tumefaciens]
MSLNEKPGTANSRSDLEPAGVDGTQSTGLPTASEIEGPTVALQRSFFQQLLLDFAYGCEFFYPLQQYEAFTSKAKDDDEN